MDSILNELGLGTLKERFEVERIDPEVVESLTDGNLASLGLTRMGERARLREVCARYVQKRKDEGGNEPVNYRDRIMEERQHLFQPTGSSFSKRASGKGRKRKAEKTQKSWSFQFMCLADRLSYKTPSAVEKQILYKAGLGLKKLKLNPDDDEDAVKEKIMSDATDSDGNPLGFPALQSCGGFELMQSSANCRDLIHIDCCWSAKDLKAHLAGGQGKIYIVPIQRSLSTKPVQERADSTLKEKCHNCHKAILIRELRKHMWECKDEFGISDDHDDDDDDLMQPALWMFGHQSGSATSTTTQPQPTQPAQVVQTRPTLVAQQQLVQPAQPQPAQPAPNAQPQPAQPAPNAQPQPAQPAQPQLAQSDHNNAVDAVVDLTDDNDTAPSAEVIDDSVTENMTVDEVIEKTIHYCNTNNCSNPVEILRCLQKFMVTGRALDVENDSEANEGETNYIIIDRQNLLETAFDEINSLSDYRKTLEVQFYDEEARDYGGPLKEFFHLAPTAVKETYFDNGPRELMKEKYTSAGIILGLSIIQNGKLPTFLTEEMLRCIFSDQEPGPCLKELQDGLKKVGIYQIGSRLPIFLHLLRPGPAHAPTVKNITHLLKPFFSEEGSNARIFENAVYAKFLKYLRQVASGRRNGVKLAHILRFTTGAEEEPVLGFVLHPCLVFAEVSNSFLPTANTCINCLCLPRLSMAVPLPKETDLFDMYDLAFSNAYFGHV